MISSRTHYALVCVMVGLSAVGCGHEGCTVGGKVLLNGRPMKTGRIALSPQKKAVGTRTAEAVVTNGQFCFSSNQGLGPGSYRVAITAKRATGETSPPEEGTGEIDERYEQYLPAKYNSDSELAAEVDGNREDLLFELELSKE